MAYRILYSLCYLLAFPLVLLWLYRPWQRRPGFGRRWPEHYGVIRRTIPQGGLWLHTVSVGEVLASVPLVRLIQQHYPHLPIVMTTTTRTGADRIAAAFGDSVTHVYAPLDLPPFVAGFLNRASPRLIIIMETELWPNMLSGCWQRQIPVLLANARLSKRSADRYRRFDRFSAWLFSHLDLIAAQHRDDGARFTALGLPAERLQICGSIKFDLSLPEDLPAKVEALRSLAGQRPTWCAASTHKGEDERILTAHRQVLAECPDALLVLVPRHPERFDDVAQLCQRQGFSLVRRSQGQPAAGAQVMLGDSMGELLAYCGIADWVFMAGSFAPIGGHNMLEPAALGKPVLSGPHTFNFTDIVRQMQAVGALAIVADEQALARQLVEGFRQPDEAARRGAAGLTVVENNRGALQRCFDALAPWLNKLG